MFCTKCGTKNEEGTNFCSSCGESLNSAFKPEPVKEKNGKSIASMVLGIVAVVWAFIVLLGLGSLREGLIQSIMEDNVNNVVAYKFGYFFGYNFISLPCSIIGLILGLVSKKNGKAIAGIIMTSIALFIALISFVIIVSTTV